MTPRVIVDDQAALRRAFAADFARQADVVLATRERFTLALPGGSVAAALLPALAALSIDWGRIDIFWVDERAVPPDHPDSNYRLAKTLLLDPARVPAERVHRLYGELPDLDEAARRASDELTSIAGDPAHLDLVLAGVGEDGHVASIFPGRPEKRNPSPSVIAVYDSPKPPARRLTMTLPVLARAALVNVAAFGSSKAVVMQSALAPEGSTPVAELLSSARSAIVLLDHDAGAFVRGADSLS